MSVTCDEALATLQAMFGTPWTKESLSLVLRLHKGHVENTVESILTHGENDPQILIDRLNVFADEEFAKKVQQESSVWMDEVLAKQLSLEEIKRSSTARQEFSQSRLDSVSIGAKMTIVPPSLVYPEAPTLDTDGMSTSPRPAATANTPSSSSYFSRSTAALNIGDDNERERLI
mmetsp:Transcript_8727/g.12347  ORF Transcript_8727/g.12347 Transcript_8727/m.12347 type:complete len:174 (-) Transcript_8727:16-537(-)